MGEVGEFMYNNGTVARLIMDHPVATGIIIGAAGGAVAYFASQLISRGWLVATTVLDSYIVKQSFDKIKEITSGSYNIASNGGKHAGFLNNIIKLNLPNDKIMQSINSLEKAALRHLNYVANPSTYEKYNDFIAKTATEQSQTMGSWLKEAYTYTEQANVLRGYLEKLIN